MGFQDKFVNEAVTKNLDGNLDWFRRIDGVMEYLESNLLETINYEKAAQIACCSVHHFQRLFSFITGIPLSEYVRRRRLTLAAFDLQNENIKVIDTAIKYGYDSPASFTRAFKNMHGINPSAVCNSNACLKAFPQMTFQLSIKGDSPMNYRLEQREAFELFGVTTEVINDQSHETVPAFWVKCRTNGILTKMHDDIGLKKDTMLHVATYNCEDTKHTYMICYQIPSTGAPEGYSTLSIPIANWVVFSIENLSITNDSSPQISDMWKRIFTEWFPTSGNELAPNVPELEMHFNQGDGTYLCEIWIPIIKR